MNLNLLLKSFICGIRMSSLRVSLGFYVTSELYLYIMGKKILMRLIFHVVCVSRLKENMLDSSKLHLILLKESQSIICLSRNAL